MPLPLGIRIGRAQIRADTLGRYLSSYPPWAKRLIVPATVPSGRIQTGNTLAIEPCDTPTNWTNLGGAPTIAADTVNYMCALDSYQAVKFTATSGTSFIGQRDYTAGDDINLTGAFCYIRFYIWEGTGDSSYVHFTGGGGAGETSGSAIAIQFGDEVPASSSILSLLAYPYVKPGWHEAWVHMDLAGGAFAPTRLQKIYFRGYMGSGKTPSVTLDEISFWPEARPLASYNSGGVLTPIPLVAVRFDNGYTRDYKAAAYAHAKGIALNFGITPTKIGESGYLTLTEAQNLYRFGRHLFVNHSYTHAVQGTLTEAQAWAEYTSAVEWMIANGFTRGARIYIVPADWARDESWTAPGVAPYDILVNQDCGNINTLGLQPLMTSCVIRDNPTASHAIDLGNALPDSDVAAIAIGGSAGGDFLMTNGHMVDDTDLTNAKAHINTVSAANSAATIRVVTLDQLQALLLG